MPGPRATLGGFRGVPRRGPTRQIIRDGHASVPVSRNRQPARTVQGIRRGVPGNSYLPTAAGYMPAPRVRALQSVLSGGYPGLDSEQSSLLETVLRRGLKSDATYRDLLSAAETGLVESNLRNLPGGDADSQGWRQERTSIYGTGPTGPRNVKASADRFYRELKVEGAGAATPGLAAQGAQGSAYPDRYDEKEPFARQLVNHFQKRQKAASILGKPDVAGVPAPVAQKQVTRYRAAIRAMKGIQKEQLPYVWGGGHQIGPIPRGIGLDCSASVTAVLQRAGYKLPQTLVADQFKSWGKPGPGALTIYAKGDHVLMSVQTKKGEKFFGTSGSNPGGGPGWIDRSQLGEDYLSQFVQRHAPGLGKKTAAGLGVAIAQHAQALDAGLGGGGAGGSASGGSETGSRASTANLLGSLGSVAQNPLSARAITPARPMPTQARPFAAQQQDGQDFASALQGQRFRPRRRVR